MQIDVTEQDIKDGIRTSCSSCPVARALIRTLGHSCYVSLDYVDIILVDDKIIRRNLPHIAVKSIADFDSGVEIKPFSFDLDVPKELINARSES